MAEAVRLVVWDLDETFWKGTLTEGGCTYLREHHDIVVELARRGILSSICSKNDHQTVVDYLTQFDILDYFVFPSISWDPKGMRLASLVETVQLRAPTIMFIDDNPNNRAEAADMVPGLQVEDETFIARMLLDPRFKGKDDPELSRLKQYKLLEARKRDEAQAPAGNEAFLRSCDVRVFIEYDVETHLDRAIELINRTNQLNYTKQRLPEDIEQARHALREQLTGHNRQAGLIRVVDKYGDYGYVGFFATNTMRNDGRGSDPSVANSRFLHYCFSCRTLGMLIEQWVYDYLRRPQLNVVGEVLTDLSVPRTVDWVRLVQSLEPAAEQTGPRLPKIVLWGGCEANAVGVYLGAYAEQVEVFGSYAAGALFVRSNSALVIDSLTSRNPDDFAAEAKILSLPQNMNSADIFRNAPYGTVYVLNFSFDTSQIPLYRHTAQGWVLHVEPPYADGLNFHLSEDEFRRILKEKLHVSGEQKQHLFAVRAQISENYVNIRPLSDADCLAATRRLIARLPAGSKLIIAVDHNEAKNHKGLVWKMPRVSQYTALLRKLAAEYSYVDVVSYSDVLRGHHEIEPGGGSHYSRPVFLRFVHRVMDVLSDLSPKPDLEHESLPLIDLPVQKVLGTAEAI